MMRIANRSVRDGLFLSGLALIALAPQTVAAPPVSAGNPTRTLTAQIHHSGFALAHDTFNGLSAASDGRIYFVLSTEPFDQGARVFVFNPATGKIQDLGDLTAACGEEGKKTIVQGKSHVNFVESQGTLYFASHVGYYSIVDGMETMGIPPQGYKPYPGGHLLSLEMSTGALHDLALVPNEGVLSMNMDTARGRIFVLTWPTGRFLRFNLATRELKDFGPVCALGESVTGSQYRTICRSIGVDPRDGSAYFTDSEGTIHRYTARDDTVGVVSGDHMRKDYFGLYEPTSPGHMGYNWRQVVWVPSDQMFYGVHGNSGYLFRFAPKAERVEVLERLTSDPSRRAGMFDQFSYGYLGFTLGPDGRTIYYLTGGPVFIDGKRLAGKAKSAMGESKGIENLHLVTFDIPTERRVDHGAIFFPNGDRPAYVNSIAVGKDGTVYALSRVTREEKPRTDLISVSAAQIQPTVEAARK